MNLYYARCLHGGATGRWRRGGPYFSVADRAGTSPMDVDIERTQGPAASLWLRADPRGRDGGVREELAARVTLGQAAHSFAKADDSATLPSTSSKPEPRAVPFSSEASS